MAAVTFLCYSFLPAVFYPECMYLGEFSMNAIIISSIGPVGEMVGKDEIDPDLQEQSMNSAFKFNNEILQTPKDEVHNYDGTETTGTVDYTTIKLEGCDVAGTKVLHGESGTPCQKHPSIAHCFIKTKGIKDGLGITETLHNVVNVCEKPMDALFHVIQVPAAHNTVFDTSSRMDDLIEDSIFKSAQFKCGKCSYSSSSKEKLITHVEDICNPKFGAKTPGKCEFNCHTQNHTNKNPCSCVERKYSTHLNSQERSDIAQKPFKCSLCEYRTTQKFYLNLHLRTSAHDKPFKCNICEFTTTKKCHLTVHTRTHTGEKPYKCIICEYSSTRKSCLTVHIRTHTGERPFKCDLCEYRTSYQSHLPVHMRIHTGEKPFKCNTCEYSSSHQSHLTVHIRTHTCEKPFKCNICEYSSTRKCSLTVHMRTHTGERPFECNICEYRSSHQSHLRVHMRLHTGEKPVHCKICDYKTSYKHALEMHMRVHTGEKSYKCDICQNRFYHKCTLLVHMRNHSDKKFFKCDMCKHSTNRKNDLIKHIKTHNRRKPFKPGPCNNRQNPKCEAHETP